MNKITEFRGPTRWLSNFERCEVTYEGVIYSTSEHAYQAAKTIDPQERKRIAQLPKPGDAKRAGQKATLRPDWEQIKLQVMEEITLDKFTRNKNLQQKLLDTGDAELEEGNTWGDKYWGKVNGLGRNELGKILMRVRAKLRGG